MTRYTKQLRQEIVKDFCDRHDGRFDPQLFVQEVKETGPSHPAYDWFEFDTEKAANEYNLAQARAFVRDLRIEFTVKTVKHTGGPITIKVTEMPLVISPAAGRQYGGGYFLTDHKNPAHQEEHCHQAAAALRQWLDRYQAAMVYAGCNAKSIESIAERLEAVGQAQAAE